MIVLRRAVTRDSAQHIRGDACGRAIGQSKDGGKIARVESAFDARPYEAMFTGKTAA